jgi:Fic family protein
LLYLSLYFKTHRSQYYALLDHVRKTGDWESWLYFFAEAVVVTAEQAMDTAQRLTRKAADDRETIDALDHSSGSMLKVHRVLQERPITSAAWITAQTSLAPATVNTALQNLEEIGIVMELTGKKRNRLFSYIGYLEILNERT